MDIETQTSLPGGNSPDRLVTLAQARGIVGISRSKIYQLLADDDFPRPVKVGRNNLFSFIELQRWIASMLTERASGDDR